VGVNALRILLIAAAAALLILPAARQAKACELDAYAAELAPVLGAAALVTQEFSAEEKKIDDKKPMKKTAKMNSKKKMKKEKVEYMRAAPM
jgi:hypothetical protein